MNNQLSITGIIEKAAEDKKAEDIKIMNVSEISPITDYFIVCSGDSMVQVKAIADEIEDRMDKAGYTINHREGYNDAKWILLDYNDVIVHIFYKEEREFYNIERLWADAKTVNV